MIRQDVYSGPVIDRAFVSSSTFSQQILADNLIMGSDSQIKDMAPHRGQTS